MVLHSQVGSINFADPATMREVHEALISKERNEAIYISYKYKIQIAPM